MGVSHRPLCSARRSARETTLSPQEKTIEVQVDAQLKQENILRRHLDLPKYLELLRSRSLYFRRADRFPDKFEGVLPSGIYQSINAAYAEGKTTYDAETFLKRVREGMFVNCW